MFILLGHRKQVGKDTLATLMIEEFYRIKAATPHVLKVEYAEKIGFATLLYETCEKLFGIREKEFYDRFPHHKNDIHGDTGMTVREILIRVGNDMRAIDEDVWVKALRNRCSNDNTLYIITDLRYPNEARHFRNDPQYKVVSHKAERSDDVADCALDGHLGWDAIVPNDWGMKELREKAHRIIVWNVIETHTEGGLVL